MELDGENKKKALTHVAVGEQGWAPWGRAPGAGAGAKEQREGLEKGTGGATGDGDGARIQVRRAPSSPSTPAPFSHPPFHSSAPGAPPSSGAMPQVSGRPGPGQGPAVALESAPHPTLRLPEPRCHPSLPDSSGPFHASRRSILTDSLRPRAAPPVWGLRASISISSKGFEQVPDTT